MSERTTQLHIRATPGELMLWRQFAKGSGMTLSQWIREAITVVIHKYVEEERGNQ